MKTAIRVVFVLLLEVTYLSLAGAHPLSPKRLNTDPNLAALIAVRGHFTSLLVDQQQALTLPVWAADFSPDEQVDFEQLVNRSFSQLDLPEQPGWGLFEPTGQHLEIQVRVTDQQGRLGRVEFRDPDTWQLIASIWANAIRTEASGVFSIPADRREMVAEVLNDVGRVLVRMAVDVGKFDTVVPVPVRGTFVPYYYEPVFCPHFGEQPGDAYGIARGDPYTAPGAKTYVDGSAGRSGTTVYKDFTNDNILAVEVLPPPEFWSLWRKKTIANTVNFELFKVADPQAMAQLVQAVNTAAAEDPARALSPVQALPYSEGCARWRVGFTGQATAVLAIPYERKKRQRTLGAFLSALNTLLRPQRGFLSVLVANAAEQWLQDLQNQQSSGLKPGEVVAWGDVYSVLTDSVRDIPRALNLTEEWTVYVKLRYPDGRGGWIVQDAEGPVKAQRISASTTPAPPARPSPGTVYVGKSGGIIKLGKGWRWKLWVDVPGGGETEEDVPSDNRVAVLYITLQTPPSEPPGEQ